MTRLIVESARKALQFSGPSVSRVCAYHAPAHHQATLNDMPVPQGSWKTDYDAKQRKYNFHLLAGVGFTVVTLVTARASGLFDFNYSVPKLRDQ